MNCSTDLSCVVRDEKSAKNTDIINLHDMNLTTIVTLKIGKFSEGDRILVNGHCTVNHESDGGVHIGIYKDSGSANIEFMHDKDYISSSAYNENATQSSLCLSAICKIKSGGDLVLKFGGVTDNTVTANVPSGFCQIYTAFLGKAT